jgi:hypothetical protein
MKNISEAMKEFEVNEKLSEAVGTKVGVGFAKDLGLDNWYAEDGYYYGYTKEKYSSKLADKMTSYWEDLGAKEIEVSDAGSATAIAKLMGLEGKKGTFLEVKLPKGKITKE